MEKKVYCCKCGEELWLGVDENMFVCQNKTCGYVGMNQRGEEKK